MDIYSDTNAVVKSNGSVEWLTPVLLTSTCPQDAKLYPFDVQVSPDVASHH